VEGCVEAFEEPDNLNVNAGRWQISERGGYILAGDATGRSFSM